VTYRATRLAVALALAISAALVFVVPSPRVRADGGAHIGIATASGTRATYTVPNFIIVSTVFDGGGPIAQAVFNNSGDATGFGSLPYPGDTVVNAPGVVAVATGQSIPVSYPFFVQAVAPTTPEATFADPSGVYALKATASDKEATGLAAIGAAGSPSGSTSTSSVKTDASGKITAVADATVRGIDVSGVLKIASVTSHSETVLGPTDTKPVTKASTVVEGVTVAGVGVVVGPDGIGLAGQTVGAAAVTEALNAALKQAGLTVKTVAAQPVAGGASTTALQVTHVGAVPVPGTPTGTLVYDFASASSSIISGIDGGGVGDGAPDALSADGGGDNAGSGGDLSAAFSSDASGLPGVRTPLRAGRTGSPQATLASQQLLARDLRGAFQGLYVVVAVGAALVLTGSALWRSRAVRVPWMPDR
jgi:hypothetical protein